MADKKSETTLDDLANMVGRGFQRVDEQFKRVDEQFKRVDEQFAELRIAITEVDHKVDLVRTDVAELRFDYKKMLSRIENLELKTFGSVRE